MADYNKTLHPQGSASDNIYPITKAENVTGLSTLLDAKETVDNKVTTLSTQSTDTQYPSAKCVYDLVGNIETLLGAI